MDIVRADRSQERNRRRIMLAAGAAAVVAALTLGLSRLEPAAPGVDRSAIVIETVKRGPMVREVRGTGTLVPLDANWIAASADARVARIVTRPGTAVRSDTVILELADPAQVQRTLDARYRLLAGEADLVSLRLHELPPGADADRCRQLRRELSLGADPEDPAFVTGDGAPLAVADLPRFLRFARLVARSLEGNAGLCRGLLKTRYALTEPEEVAA